MLTSAKVDAAMPPADFPRAIKRNEEVIDSLKALHSRIADVADRVCGSIPRPAPDKPDTGHSGVLATLIGASDVQLEIIQMLHGELARLERTVGIDPNAPSTRLM